jgi:hypothetical protein
MEYDTVLIRNSLLNIAHTAIYRRAGEAGLAHSLEHLPHLGVLTQSWLASCTLVPEPGSD